MATSGNYRIKELPVSNVPAKVSVEGRFALGTNGAVGACRPSAGSASGSNGNLWTVTQLPTFNSLTNAAAYQIVFTEGYFKNVSGIAAYHPAYSLTTPGTEYYTCQTTEFDTTTNSIVVFLVDEGRYGGSTPASAVLPQVASGTIGGSIYFEQVFLNTVSPQTT